MMVYGIGFPGRYELFQGNMENTIAARHLPQQGRVAAVAVDHQAPEATARGLARQQLAKQAARTVQAAVR